MGLGDPDPSNHRTGFEGADEIVDWFQRDKPDDWSNVIKNWTQARIKRAKGLVKEDYEPGNICANLSGTQPPTGVSSYNGLIDKKTHGSQLRNQVATC